MNCLRRNFAHMMISNITHSSFQPDIDVLPYLSLCNEMTGFGCKVIANGKQKRIYALQIVIVLSF